MTRTVAPWCHTLGCNSSRQPTCASSALKALAKLNLHVGPTGEGSVVSFSAFWVTVAALGATVLTAWGGYGKNSETGLSLKRVGPLPAVKVITCLYI